MRRFLSSKFTFAGLLILAIVVGVAWGLKIKKAADIRRAPEADASVLKILALKNSLPFTFIKAFEAHANIKVELTEASTPEAVLLKLEGNEKYDLVTLMSTQTAGAAAAQKIQPIKLNEISGSDTISPDFLNLPGEEQRPTSVPVSWGLIGLAVPADSGEPVKPGEQPNLSWVSVIEKKPEGGLELLPSTLNLALLSELTAPSKENEAQFLARGQRLFKSTTHASDFLRSAPPTEPRALQLHHGESAFSPYDDESAWRFAIPTEGSELWVLSLSFGGSVENTAGADRFIEYILKPANAASLAQASHQASCNRAVESNTKLLPKLKPSYLRALPLERIKVPNAELITRAKLLKDLK